MSIRAFGISVVATLCSGCVGFAFHGNEHHRADSPVLTADRAHYDSSNRRFPVPAKNQVLAAWGKPDRIEIEPQTNMDNRTRTMPTYHNMLTGIIISVSIIIARNMKNRTSVFLRFSIFPVNIGYDSRREGDYRSQHD